MQEIITRAAAAAEKVREIPIVGAVLAASYWARVPIELRVAREHDTATTDELLEEAKHFDPKDKNYPLRAMLQFNRLRDARRAGR